METSIEQRTNIDLGLTLEGGWVLLPLLSALGGAWAYNPGLWTEEPARLAIALGLIVGGWQSLWRALTRTDWAAPLGQWPGWSKAAPLPAWPYVQPGTPGEALHRRLSYAKAWWQEAGRASLAHPLKRAISAIAVTLLLSAALGRETVILSMAYLAWTELAVLWHEGRGEVGPIWGATALIAGPWFLGATLNDGNLAPAALSSVALALMIGLYAHTNGWAVVGPLAGAAFLLWRGHADAVGWLLLLFLPGLITLTVQPDRDAYRRTIGPWVIGIVALLAWVL
ncbi:MAG: hypothetical protein JXC32_10650 [Anaerolineae bacterium]|nr:hypothetical protein [Anaerolineae bacterium]